MVIGTVLDKYGDNYKVDIDCAVPATLSVLSFEGASRKNQITIPVCIKFYDFPSSTTIQNGGLLYARVTVANKDIEPEIVCVSQKNKADGFGELKGGMLIQVSLGYARQYVLLFFSVMCCVWT